MRVSVGGRPEELEQQERDFEQSLVGVRKARNPSVAKNSVTAGRVGRARPSSLSPLLSTRALNKCPNSIAIPSVSIFSHPSWEDKDLGLLKHLYDFAESRQLSDAFKPGTTVRWSSELYSDGDVVGAGPRETQGTEPNRERV